MGTLVHSFLEIILTVLCLSLLLSTVISWLIFAQLSMPPCSFLKCLADDTRLKSLLLIAQAKEACVCNKHNATYFNAALQKLNAGQFKCLAKFS
jgi:hypothetical protein